MNLSRAGFVLLAPEAFLTCWKYRLLLWFRPVPTLNLPAPPLQPASTRFTTLEISRAVYFTSRLVAVGNCLPQAMTFRDMMMRRGKPCTMEIGVSLKNGFAAHAWVTENGRIAHGDNGYEYSQLRRTGAPDRGPSQS